MRARHHVTVALLVGAGATAGLLAVPGPAAALDPVKPVCTVASLFSGLAGKACTVLQKGEGLLSKGKQALGDGGGSTAAKAIGLAAIGAWVLVGAKVALHETAKVIDHTTSPALAASWFSKTYARMAAIAALLTLPFLFAAVIQALIRSDLALLLRAAFGYLPLAVLGVSIAAPMTSLLLSATDEMCAVVSAAAGNAGADFLSRAGLTIGGLAVLSGSPFIAFVVGLFTVTGAIVLWAEMLMREVAVYVVVLMLPIAFSALVWPARRVWAVRSVEVLIALILSKFAVVAVLALGGAALAQSPFGGVAGTLTGAVLVSMAAFAPWALVRLLPLAELASGAAGALRGEGSRITRAGRVADALGDGLTAAMDRRSEEPQEFADLDPDYAARSESERLTALTPLPATLGSSAGARSGDWADDWAGGGPADVDGEGPAGDRWDLSAPAASGSPPGAAPRGPATVGATASGAGSHAGGGGATGIDPASARRASGAGGPGGGPGDGEPPAGWSPELQTIFARRFDTGPTLDLTGEWPPPPVIPPADDGGPNDSGGTGDLAPTAPGAGSAAEELPAPAARGGDPARGEEHDPLPPATDPEDGRL